VIKLDTIGKITLAIAMAKEGEEAQTLIDKVEKKGYAAARGQVGSMQMEKVIAAVETTARREGLISDVYRDTHSLYHAIMEALSGVCRGQFSLGNALRTVGLGFAVVCGPKDAGDSDEEKWLAVAFYGTIGAPIKGFEHEAIGLGINHF